MSDPVYRRVIVKLSGEALSGAAGFGIDQANRPMHGSAADLVATLKLGIELGVVIGGGNIFRGVEVSARGVPRPVGDTMGMLATVMNCLVLEAAIERAGAEARTLSALAMPSVCETYNRKRALKNLGKGRIVDRWGQAPATRSSRPTRPPCCVLQNSNARPYSRPPTSTASIRPDPKKDPKATRYERLTHQEAIEKEPGLRGHGWRSLRACPGKSLAYHCVLGRREGCDRGGAVRQGPFDRCRLAYKRFAPATLSGAYIRGIAMATATHDINDIKRRMAAAPARRLRANCQVCAPGAPRRTCSIR